VLFRSLRVIECPAKDRERLINEIRKDVSESGATELVLGLPLDMDTGNEGPMAKKIHVFGEALAEATSLPLHYVDERLTSAEADWQMAQTGFTHKQKKARRDALAAANILRTYLNENRP